MHNKNEASHKHRVLRRIVSKQLRRHHDDLVSALSSDNGQFLQKTLGKASVTTSAPREAPGVPLIKLS